MIIPSAHWRGILEATYVQSLDAAQDTNCIHLSHSITSIHTSEHQTILMSHLDNCNSFLISSPNSSLNLWPKPKLDRFTENKKTNHLSTTSDWPLYSKESLESEVLST